MPKPPTPARSGLFRAAISLRNKTMDAERINALGTLINDLRARTDALRGYL
jgi:hypothetical protein